MVKFTIKCLLIAALFFFGVLVGIQKASEGIQDVRQGSVQLKIEHSIQQPKGANPLSGKKVALEHIQTFNPFSAAGDLVSSAVTGIFRIGINATSTLIAKYLS